MLKISTLKIVYTIGVILLCLVLKSCANIASPTGGYKDIRKPRIRFSSPKNQSIFVTGNKISIQFDEEVELKNIKTNLTIIPNTENDYEYKLNKNRLTLIFEKPFLPNTTYVLIFDEAITDITEKNKPTNMRLAFSTGAVIDSLRMSGFVHDIFTNKPEKEAVVMLYNALDTFKVEKHKPLYYAKTDTSGRYSLNNIKAGNYLMYALTEDKKKNLIYDDSKEKIGFSADTLKVNSNSLPFADFKLINYDFRTFKVSTKRPKKQYYEVKANKNIYAAKVQFEDANLVGKILYNIEKEVLRFYNNTGQASTDSLLTYITLKDSVGNEAKDTIKVKFDAIKPKEKKAQPLSVQIFPMTNSKFMKDELVAIKFLFSVPVTTFHVDSLLLRVNKDTLQLSADDFEFDSTQTSLKFKKSFKITESIAVQFKKKTFVSVENDTLKTPAEAVYSIKKSEDFAKLSGIVRTKHPHFVLQLLNDKDETEQQLVDKEDFTFEYVIPGKKRFRLVIDKNNNGKWDAGDFKKRIPPEEILFFADERLNQTAPNWEYEDIIIEVKE